MCEQSSDAIQFIFKFFYLLSRYGFVCICDKSNLIYVSSYLDYLINEVRQLVCNNYSFLF